MQVAVVRGVGVVIRSFAGITTILSQGRSYLVLKTSMGPAVVKNLDTIVKTTVMMVAAVTVLSVKNLCRSQVWSQ